MGIGHNMALRVIHKARALPHRQQLSIRLGVDSDIDHCRVDAGVQIYQDRVFTGDLGRGHVDHWRGSWRLHRGRQCGRGGSAWCNRLAGQGKDNQQRGKCKQNGVVFLSRRAHWIPLMGGE